MTELVLIVALLVAAGLIALAGWILVGWTPAEAQPSDRLDRLRQLGKER